MHSISTNDIFTIKNASQFNDLAIKIFNYQAKNNTVYKKYLFHLGTKISSVKAINEIPFLPIEFFKSQMVKTGSNETVKTFYSSGTTGTKRSSHFVTDTSIYEKSFLTNFENQYGKLNDICILALLPTYLSNESSSLVYMVNKLIAKSGHPDSGFYLDNIEELSIKLQSLEKTNTKIILIGVSYALIDLAEKFPMNLSNTVIMETGGMKGKRKELTKAELHGFLSSGFGVKSIHSEYGMTELLSQAYSTGEGIFNTPPWMKILIRDTYDPFCYLEKGKSGGINIIDLANINSCSFIETSDLGKINSDNSFEVLGRFDNSDIRGCNLLHVE
ncbi:MAG: acyl transferase [Bacteroidales bacterium]|nr:acyl transferase [Bacteroidales bacterium]